jgi:hypothetical protein
MYSRRRTMSWWIPEKDRTPAWPALAASTAVLNRQGRALVAAARERLGRASWEAVVRSAHLLRELLGGLARTSAGLTRALERAAWHLEAAELEAIAHGCPLLPAEEILEDDDQPMSSIAVVVVSRRPPPIPVEARRTAHRGEHDSAQERAWRQLSNGQHPLLVTAPLLRSTVSDSLASRL